MANLRQKPGSYLTELNLHQNESLGDRISTAEASYSTSFLDHCFQEAHLWLRLPSDKNQDWALHVNAELVSDFAD